MLQQSREFMTYAALQILKHTHMGLLAEFFAMFDTTPDRCNAERL